MLKINRYYDIRCDICCKSRSVDINGGLGMWTFDAKSFRNQLKREGWKSRQNMNLCPTCAKEE
jgi:hypothetical protein